MVRQYTLPRQAGRCPVEAHRGFIDPQEFQTRSSVLSLRKLLGQVKPKWGLMQSKGYQFATFVK